ncbi:MAG: hypothetical protein ACK54V_02325 [Candidatus Kapaibacterium sp.]
MRILLHVSVVILVFTASCTRETPKTTQITSELTLTPPEQMESLSDKTIWDGLYIDTTLRKGDYSFHLRSTAFSFYNDKNERIERDGYIGTAIFIRKKDKLIYYDSTITDPIENYSVQDLDNNSIPDLYYSSSCVGSGAYGDAVIYCVDDVLSVTIVRTSNQSIYQKCGEGYAGHDYIHVANNRLRREFPVYAPDDANCCPSLGNRVIEYRFESDDQGNRKLAITRQAYFPPRRQAKKVTH